MTDTPDRGAIARELGLPAGLADVLDGSTEADMRESAERLASALGRTRGPRPDLTQGAQQRTPVHQLDRAALASMTPAQIEAARVEGRLADVLGQTVWNQP